MEKTQEHGEQAATEASKGFDPKLLDELLAGHEDAESFFGKNGLLDQLAKALVERALEAEMTHHLGHAPGGSVKNEARNTRNGKSKKRLKSEHGQVELEIPRDRQASFEPLLIPKHKTRLAGLDEKIIAMYARGLSDRDIQAQLQDLYGVEISVGLISEITDAVLDELRSWQARPLDEVYPIVYLDCLHLKIRKDKVVETRAVFLAIAVNLQGTKEVLGMWIADHEGAKFWASVLTELKNRGVQDMFIACVDGLKGFPEAIEAIFPKAQVQLCVVHLLRSSLHYVAYQERKEVAADLKTVYNAVTLEAAETALNDFEKKYQDKYPATVKCWRSNWQRVIPMFAYPQDIRRAIYTTNVIESLNFTLRKAVKTKGSFPNEEAAFKVLYLALRNVEKRWTMPIYNWKSALNLFTILFEGRMPSRFI
jgi:putative transposase